eukprot:6629924-Alexandrium_andersonii.AAC.1
MSSPFSPELAVGPEASVASRARCSHPSSPSAQTERPRFGSCRPWPLYGAPLGRAFRRQSSGEQSSES